MRAMKATEGVSLLGCDIFFNLHVTQSSLISIMMQTATLRSDCSSCRCVRRVEPGSVFQPQPALPHLGSWQLTSSFPHLDRQDNLLLSPIYSWLCVPPKVLTTWGYRAIIISREEITCCYLVRCKSVLDAGYCGYFTAKLARYPCTQFGAF
jgi:hypothetical protein